MKEIEKIKIIAQNKKAHFNYFLSDFLECGLVLKGTEIKAIRTKGCSIVDSYVVFRSNEVDLVNMHIATYEQGNIFNHEPRRTRRLLLNKKEIRYFMERTRSGGYTVVPTKVYFKRGKVKVEIALAKGKKLYDKRETIKARDLSREMKEEY